MVAFSDRIYMSKNAAFGKAETDVYNTYIIRY